MRHVTTRYFLSRCVQCHNAISYLVLNTDIVWKIIALWGSTQRDIFYRVVWDCHNAISYLVLSHILWNNYRVVGKYTTRYIFIALCEKIFTTWYYISRCVHCHNAISYIALCDKSQRDIILSRCVRHVPQRDIIYRVVCHVTTRYNISRCVVASHNAIKYIALCAMSQRDIIYRVVCVMYRIIIALCGCVTTR